MREKIIVLLVSDLEEISVFSKKHGELTLHGRAETGTLKAWIMEVVGVMVAKQEHNLFGLAFFERDDFLKFSRMMRSDRVWLST